MKNFWFFVLLLVLVSGCSISADEATRPPRLRVHEPFLTVVLPSAIPQSADNPWWEQESPVVSAPAETELFAVIGIPRGALYASIQWFDRDGQEIRGAVVFRSNTGLASQVNSEPFTLEVDTTVVYNVNGHDSRPIGDSPYSLTVSVEGVSEPIPEVTEVWVSPKSKTIDRFDYFAVSWIVYCGDEVCEDQTVSLSSSDTSVATIDRFGTVVGQGRGTTSIVVESLKDGSMYGIVQVEVRDPGSDPEPIPEVTEVWVSPKSKTIDRFDYFAVSWIVYCGDEVCEDQTVSLSSRNTSVVTIDRFGTVVGQGTGTTSIVVESLKDSSVYGIVQVEVRDPGSDPEPIPEVTEVWVSPKSKTIDRFDYFAVSWIVYCGDEVCEDQTVSLSSRNTSVVTIDRFGTVVGQGTGTTSIVVRSRKDSSVYGIVQVEVRDPGSDPEPIPEVTEVWVSPKSKTIDRFDYFAVSWIVYCGDEVCEDQTVSLSSSDTSVATIDRFGTVVGQGRGTTSIVVESLKDGSMYGIVQVEVRDPGSDPEPIPEVTEVWVSPKSKTIDRFDYFAVSWIVYCGDEVCEDQTVSLSSRNTSVVTIDRFGTVVGQGTGTTSIVVRSRKDSSVYGIVSVTVR